MEAPYDSFGNKSKEWDQNQDQSTSFTYHKSIKVILGVGVLGIAALSLSHSTNEHPSVDHVSLFTGSSSSTLSFQVGNSASSIETNDAVKAKNIAVGYPWEFLIEPYRETTFQARDNFCDDCDDQSYEWVIDGQTLYGREVSFMSTRIGSHSVQLSVTDPSGVVIQNSNSVMSKYVRREIRTLSESDREKLLVSMQAIYTHTTEEGRAKGYGTKFLDAEHFVTKHLDGSADKACDKWHDGAAFYTNHLAFTLEFEQSMQAINPDVSMPYWDFTIDQYKQIVEGINWKSSHIFSSTWFGFATSSSADHAIDSGKFAYTKVKKVGTSTSTKHNAWGLLRSPWNVNNSPYVTRSAKVDGFNTFEGELPSCKSYMDCFMSSDIAVMNECMNGKAHGSAHVEIGGVWNKDISNSIIKETSGYNLLLMTKNLWRQGYVMCPSECASGEEDACMCVFNEEAAGDLTAYEILKTTGMFSWLYVFSSLVYLDDNNMYRITGLEGSEQETAAWEILLRDTLATPGYVGEMFSSASPYDPTFWLIHGTIDRLLHWRRLIAHSDYVDMPLDEKWGYAHNVDAASDSNLVCDWTVVDMNDPTSMPKCSTGECPGTDKDDESSFGDFTSSDTGTLYTNVELYEFLSPLNDDLPYTYDNFEWAHCDEQDLKFGVQSDGTVLTSYSFPKKGQSPK